MVRLLLISFVLLSMVVCSPLACTTKKDVTPPLVATEDVTGVTSNEATLNGDLTSLGTASGVDVSFLWGTEPGSYANETTTQSITAAGAFSLSLTGLNAGTTYYYKAKVVGDGTGFGLEKSFTTSTITPAVATNDATNISTNSARLNGELTSLGTADNVTVSFEWGLDTSYGSETMPQVMIASGSLTADLSGLSPFTTYHFRTKAAGHGTALGADAQFTTGTIPPTVTTSGGSAHVFMPTSATIWGELTSLGTADNVTVSFEWGLDTSYGNETIGKSMSSTGGFSAELLNLQGLKVYHFRAKAVGHGTSYGADMSFPTAPAPQSPPSVRTDPASNIGSTSARLNGYLLGLGTFDSVPTMFYWGTAAGGPYPNGTSPWQYMTSTGAFYFDLGGLSPETTYYYVAATKDIVNTIYGAEMSFTTSSGP